MDRLLERWRPYDERRLTGRELRVEAAAAGGLVAVAVAMAVALPSGRAFDLGVAAALIVCLALASRVRLHLGAGFAMPTQLVFVPMLFLLPPSLVPACVAVALGGAALVDAARRRGHPERLLTGTADAWHAVGPALVMVAAGAPDPDLDHWLVVAAALGAQFGTDLIAATLREWLGRGIALTTQIQVVLSVYLIDACLTPLGVLIAIAGATEPYAFLLAVPLLLMLAALAVDRRKRIREAVGQLDQLSDEHARLDRAVHRIGEAFGSKLDRAALLDLGLRTAVDAVGGDWGRAEVAFGTVTQPDDGTAPTALETAAAGAQRAGALRVVEADGFAAMAQPLTGGRRAASTEVLVVARKGAAFAADERALFAYLVQQTALAMENVALHDQLRRQATMDELTGLSNHRRFHEALALEVTRMGRSDRPTALAMMDIDDFKAINDTHGHQHGDGVLQAVAEAVRGACRSTDEPARYGGDELAVILPETDLAGARRLGETLRAAVAATGHSVSVGVSAMEPGAGEPRSLIEAADVALYEAKRGGKNRMCGSAWAHDHEAPPGRFARA
jgi:diguanylate cyclase (GGDEF)-like protein